MNDNIPLHPLASIETISNSIFLGWNRFNSFIEATQDEEQVRVYGPEYLATVCIAECLAGSIRSTDVSFVLEDQTKKTYERRYDFYPIKNKRGHILGGKREESNTEIRNGRFDIVIYNKKSNRIISDIYRTIGVIEIKNFEANYDRHRKDIDRINEIVNATRENTSLSFGILTFSKETKKQKWNIIDNNSKKYLVEHNEKMRKKLKLNDKCGIISKLFSCRYSDIEYPAIIFQYIVSNILITRNA